VQCWSIDEFAHQNEDFEVPHVENEF
jgi:hypothetical protein